MNKCLECGNQTVNPKFCNRSCAAKYNNKHYPKRKRTKNTAVCPICGDEFYLKNGGKYCSVQCYGISKRDINSPFRGFLLAIKKRSKSKGWDVVITVDDLRLLWTKQKGRCAISGIRMILPETSRLNDRVASPYMASVDRVDSDKPYILNNIQFVTLGINYAKKDFDQSVVIRFIEDIRLM